VGLPPDERQTPLDVAGTCATVLLKLAAVVAVLAVVAAFALPYLLRSSDQNPEVRAIGSLKTLEAAQALFREADKDGDGVLDFGTLSELGSFNSSGLIDGLLATGTKGGYLFEATYGAQTSEFLWIATAHPAPGSMGRRFFVTNHANTIYFTTYGPFEVDSVSCEIPIGAIPLVPSGR
jgi:type II secretory pathway pseudopilin PulG